MQLYSLKQWTKREVYTTALIYVWTFENQVQVLYASLEVWLFFGFRRSETQNRLPECNQGAGEVFDSKDNFEKTTTMVNGVDHQKTVNVEKGLKTE